MKLKPHKAHNIPDTPISDLLLSEKADPAVVKKPSYDALVSKFNIAPDKAKKLLGIEVEPSS